MGADNNSSWAAEAIEAACRSAEQWMRGLDRFDPQPKTSDGAVVASRYPALLSERDCVLAFARLLHDEGVPWDAIHNELSISRWIFDSSHRAGRKMSESGRLRRVDLALVKPEELLHSTFPATDPGFQFDAFVEFGHLTAYWTVPDAQNYGAAGKAHSKVRADIEKISVQVQTGACRVGYVVVFEEADLGLEKKLVSEAAAEGCQLRFIRGYLA